MYRYEIIVLTLCGVMFCLFVSVGVKFPSHIFYRNTVASLIVTNTLG